MMRILIVDADRTLREGCASLLSSDYNVMSCARGDEALEMLGRRTFDILLVDLHMTPVTGMHILERALGVKQRPLVVIMAADPTVTTSVNAIRAGAWDYLPKPFSATHLQVLIGRAAHTLHATRDAEIQPPAMRSVARPRLDDTDLFSASPAFRKVTELARRIALSDASVMLTGESGTGKEIVARYIHAHSRRAQREMVSVNCAGIPDSLVESEMFGHCRGAYTGAHRDKSGLFELASGSTLYLDEVSEMAAPLQAKLLRVIQEGTVRRVGSDRAPVSVDVRLISSTNRDLGAALRDGILREDLVYRLRVVPIHLPPLRDRPEDIPALTLHFLQHFWARHRVPGEPRPTITAETLRFLTGREWRGNVRELQNNIEHLAIVAEPGQVINPDDIPLAEYEHFSEDTAYTLPKNFANEGYHSVKEKVVAQFDQAYVARLVDKTGGNLSKAARLANIDRTTLYRIMEKNNLRRETDLSASAS